MKKFMTVILAIMLVFSATLTGFAEGETEVGSITIDGIGDGTTYSIYKILDLTGYDKETGAYSYTVEDVWKPFAATTEAQEYFTVDGKGNVTWIAGRDDATVAEFAKLALDYAKEATNNVPAIQSGKVAVTNGVYSATAPMTIVEGNKGKFSGLELGWYLVDSTAGALCGLTTTDPDAAITTKNETPTVDKQVQEDLTGLWGDSNTADIGQIVNFMTIIHVAAGPENYVFHDKMSAGLTFTQDLTIDENNPNDVPRGVTLIEFVDSSANVKSNLVLGQDYTVKTAGFGDDCTFEVEFSDTFIADLEKNDRIIVYYNAMLNRHAEVGPNGANTNESYLEYGEDHFTTHDQTKTYTFSIDIVKTDSSNQLLDGAKFRVYDAATGGNEIKVVPLLGADDVTPVLDENGNQMYRRARADETGVDIEVVNGVVTVVGFDNGDYYLEETEAPDGYNKLTDRTKFTIQDKNIEASFTADDLYVSNSGVHVVNQKGTMLPETGAGGTTLFITLGTILILGTGVLLVTKKRMSMMED